MNNTNTEAADLDLDDPADRRDLARRMAAALNSAKRAVNHPALADLGDLILILGDLP